METADNNVKFIVEETPIKLDDTQSRISNILGNINDNLNRFTSNRSYAA